MPARRKGEDNVRKKATAAVDIQRKRKTSRIRIGAMAVILTMVLWVALSFGGGHFGLPIRYAFLLDFAAMAAFAWAIIVMWPSLRERFRAGGD